MYEPALIQCCAQDTIVDDCGNSMYLILVKLPEVHFCARGALGETLLDPATISGLSEIALLNAIASE